ncbi:hypothetical protein LMG28614_01856 [Paraburkholderia ultramafica]|uniref:Uncharacterized protein n=1 Tax=Paraburkholderia ultramafica TaxID=1544867 RepID=A0A6S7C948_9BURK|nr:hypothetical protein [Paraburkholderia ultramafica]CAB3784038.1 hypothetical protein LMG28614_01856 [Paraburkholderia ultramafica]
MIRGESVVLVAEKPRSGGAGNTGLLASIGSAFVAYDDGETREQMRAFARSILYPPGEPVLSGSYDPATQQAKLIAARASIATIGGAFDDAADASTLLGDAQPFEYTPDAVSGDVDELAASTNNPRFAAKMLGYDQNTFSDMLHVFKPANGLGPADNVIFHDDGSIEFNGQMLDDNIHDYAP